MTPTFLNPPMHFTLDEFRIYLSRLSFDWTPKFPTLHNTGVPSLAQWEKMGATPQERWGGNLDRYYQGMGWHSGPHLVVCPDYVWVLCDLTKSGVSVSCWNSETFGIEMVGNYEVGGDDFTSGDGAKVRDNAAQVLAILDEVFGFGDLSDIEIGVKGLHFHHDCAADHHACPGSKVTKADVLMRIEAARAALGDKAAATPPAVMLPPAKLADTHHTAPAINSVDDIQAALNGLGVMPIEPVTGHYGPLTIERVKAFQSTHACFVDGWAGDETKAAMCAALEAAHAAADAKAAADAERLARAAKLDAAPAAPEAPPAVVQSAPAVAAEAAPAT